MNQNISAHLDLTKSLRVFEETVTELLLFTELEEWDGRTIKNKEEKIREAALILAGQCVALLLDKLSQLKSAQENAITQTKGWWHPKTKRQGKCWRQVLTMGNVIVSLHLPYVVERRPKPKGKRKSKNQGFCPFLRWLGMEEGAKLELIRKENATRKPTEGAIMGNGSNLNYSPSTLWMRRGKRLRLES